MTEIIIKSNIHKSKDPRFTITSALASTSINENPKETLSIWACIDNSMAKQKPKIPNYSGTIMEIQKIFRKRSRNKNPLTWWNENSYSYPYLK